MTQINKYQYDFIQREINKTKQTCLMLQQKGILFPAEKHKAKFGSFFFLWQSGESPLCFYLLCYMWNCNFHFCFSHKPLTTVTVTCKIFTTKAQSGLDMHINTVLLPTKTTHGNCQRYFPFTHESHFPCNKIEWCWSIFLSVCESDQYFFNNQNVTTQIDPWYVFKILSEVPNDKQTTVELSDWNI